MHLQLGRNGAGGELKDMDRERMFAKKVLVHGGGYEDDELVKYTKLHAIQVASCPALNFQ